MKSICGIDHIVLTVKDIKRSAKFYSVLFDKEIVTKPFSFKLCEFGAKVFFVEWKETKEGDIFDEKRVGLDHFAIGLKDSSDLTYFYQSILKAWKELDATIDDGKCAGIETCEYTGSKYICFRDPDNIQIEFYTATD